MKQRITPAIMVIASILVIATLLMASIAVTAFTSDKDSNTYIESDALRLIPSIVDEDEDDD